MEVLALELHLTADDLNAVVRKVLPPDSPVEDLQVMLAAGTVGVRGVYPLLVNVSFECWWEADVAQGKVRCRLTQLKAMGMPGMVFKSAVLRALQSAAKREYWLDVRGDEVHIDPEYLLARHLLPGKLNLKALQVNDGSLVLKAGR